MTASDDRLASDVLTVGWSSAAFGNANVGNGKAITITGVGLTGSDAGNYVIAAGGIASASITPRTLTLAANRVYDGTTAIAAPHRHQAFGFEDPSIRIPMRVEPSVFPEPESEAQLMLQSFGQGNDRVTPLQMAMASAAVANGGKLMTPNLVEQVTAPDLSVLQSFEPSLYGEPITPEVSASMIQMMVSNVASGAGASSTSGT